MQFPGKTNGKLHFFVQCKRDIFESNIILALHETKYSRMDQVKFVEDSL